MVVVRECAFRKCRMVRTTNTFNTDTSLRPEISYNLLFFG